MKYIRRFGMALVMIAAVLLLGAGMVYASEESVLGKYDAKECWNQDGSYHCEEDYLILDQGGNGEIRFNDSIYSVTWELDGNTLTIEDEEGESDTGTLKDGVIEISYVGYEYIFAREGAYTAAPSLDSDQALSTLPEEDEEQDSAGSPSDSSQSAVPLSSLKEGDEPLVFEATERENVSGASGPTEDSSVWRLDYIAMNGDGTGVFLFNKAAFSIRWKLDGESYSFVDHKGNEFNGSLTGNRISGVYGQYRYTFEQKGRMVPAYRLSQEDWGKDLDPVVDQAGVLTKAQLEEFSRKARELKDQYDVGVDIVLVDRRDDYTWTNSIETLGEEIRSGYSIGVGPTEKKKAHEEGANEDWKDSVLLTVAFDVRKYDICISGDYAVWAFPEKAREMNRDQFVDDFRDDEWAAGIGDYLDGVEKVLKVASKGHAYSFRYTTNGFLIGLAVSIGLALLFAYGIAALMRSSMKDTRVAQNAASYVSGNQIRFTRREDHYIRTLVSRVYSPREKSSSSGGGGSSSSGSSHTSGSF